jgi:hypothetical protein
MELTIKQSVNGHNEQNEQYPSEDVVLPFVQSVLPHISYLTALSRGYKKEKR